MAYRYKKKGCFECETAPTYGLITYSSGQSISATGFFVSQNKKCGKNGGDEITSPQPSCH